jgi:hypothetical protein
LPVGASKVALADGVHHRFGDVFGRLSPDVDDLVVALAVGDEAVVVLLLDLGDLALGRDSAASP